MSRLSAYEQAELMRWMDDLETPRTDAKRRRDLVLLVEDILACHDTEEQTNAFLELHQEWERLQEFREDVISLLTDLGQRSTWNREPEPGTFEWARKNWKCPTCAYPNRSTVGLVCQTCGWDYTNGEKP